jgi:preprotein translocase subunit Sss1
MSVETYREIRKDVIKVAKWAAIGVGILVVGYIGFVILVLAGPMR